MGMLRPSLNCLALEAAIERKGASARRCPPSSCRKSASCHGAVQRTISREGRIVLLGGGNGNPILPSDTTAVLRAAEIDAQAVLKATNSTASTAPTQKDPSAKRFDRLTPLSGHCRRLQVWMRPHSRLPRDVAA